MNRCETCRYGVAQILAPGDAKPDTPGALACKRYPPRVSVNLVPMSGGGAGLNQSSAWPMVRPGDFCGEYVSDNAPIYVRPQ